MMRWKETPGSTRPLLVPWNCKFDEFLLGITDHQTTFGPQPFLVYLPPDNTASHEKDPRDRRGHVDAIQ